MKDKMILPEKRAWVTRKGTVPWAALPRQIRCTRWTNPRKMAVMISRFLSPSADPGAAPEKFEDLLARLEQIVSDMENAEMPLEKLLAGYEEGMRLVKACGDRLSDAEQKVEILSRAVAPEAGKVAAEPAPAKPAEDIKLF